ncbi:MAG: hypothetical protein JSW27_11075, partial [Phycisphaerales bacterium]
SNTPVPNPMAFDPNGLPREYDSNGDPDGTPFDWVVEMMAVTATDDSGFVEYYFECDLDAFSSGWQTDPIYTTDIVGRRGQGYKFRVRARDASGNVTEWSQWVQALPRPEQAPLTGNNGTGGGGVVGGGGLGGG